MKALNPFFLTVLSILASVQTWGQNTSVQWYAFSGGFGIPSAVLSSAKSSLGQGFLGETRQANTLIISGFLADTLLRGRVVSVPDQQNVPLTYALMQNYPNPFNPLTVIQFSIAERNHVTLEVYNVLGQRVTSLIDEEKAPGIYEARFDASALSSGAYFYLLRAGTFVQTRKLLILK